MYVKFLFSLNLFNIHDFISPVTSLKSLISCRTDQQAASGDWVVAVTVSDCCDVSDGRLYIVLIVSQCVSTSVTEQHTHR